MRTASVWAVWAGLVAAGCGGDIGASARGSGDGALAMGPAASPADAAQPDTSAVAEPDGGGGQPVDGRGPAAPDSRPGDAGANGRATDAGAQARDAASPSGSDASRPDSGSAGDADVPVGEGQVRFVGVGGWGLRAWTDDGITWTDMINTVTGDDHTPDLLRDVAFGGGRFVAVGGDANSMVMISDDGKTWDEDRYPEGGVWLGGVAYLDGVWVAGGGNGFLVRSTDGGLSWSPLSDGVDFNIRDMAAGQGVFVAIGDGGQVARSTDGGKTFQQASVTDRALKNVAFGFGLFVTIASTWNGSGFDVRCLASGDGAAGWDDCGLSGDRFDDVARGPDGVVVSLADGYALTTNGEAFTKVAAAFPERIAYGDGRWVGSSEEQRWGGDAPEALTAVPGGGFRALTVGRVADAP